MFAKLCADAIRAFVELKEWHIHEIQGDLQEADAGDFNKAIRSHQGLRK